MTTLQGRTEGAEAREICLLQVRAGGARCGVELAGVREIMRPLPIQPIPELPDFVRGVAVVRGRAVPVVDLALWMGRPAGNAQRWLHLALGARRLALAVETVDGARKIEQSAWSEMPCLLRDGEQTFALSRFGQLDGEVLAVIESARLLPEPVWSLLDSTG
jgi:purine-binding chemotaxis protein CheW